MLASSSVAALAHPLSLLSSSSPLSLAAIAQTADIAPALPDFSVSEFQSGFASSFLLVLFSEIGDKTFFIAALLATRRPNLEVFVGTFAALAAMTVVSVLLGRALHIVDEIIPFNVGKLDIPLDDLAAVILLVIFGILTLKDAVTMDDGSKVDEEQEEAEKAIAGFSGGEGGGASAVSIGVMVSVFTLVFAAEWGDKSFFSTIALAAASSPAGVVAGGVVAHGLATAMAVLGGSFLATYLSEKTVAYIGGSLFLLFAASTLFEIVAKATSA